MYLCLCFCNCLYTYTFRIYMHSRPESTYMVREVLVTCNTCTVLLEVACISYTFIFIATKYYYYSTTMI